MAYSVPRIASQLYNLTAVYNLHSELRTLSDNCYRARLKVITFKTLLSIVFLNILNCCSISKIKIGPSQHSLSDPQGEVFQL